MSKLDRCQQMGICAFVRSGDLRHNECEQSGAKVLPWLKTCQRNPVHGRLPAGEPLKPMGNGPRR